MLLLLEVEAEAEAELEAELEAEAEAEQEATAEVQDKLAAGSKVTQGANHDAMGGLIPSGGLTEDPWRAEQQSGGTD